MKADFTIGEWLTLSGYNCLAIVDADDLLKASCTKPSVIVTARCPLVVRHDSSASFGFAICTFSTPKCDVALVIRHLDCQSDSSGLMTLVALIEYDLIVLNS